MLSPHLDFRYMVQRCPYWIALWLMTFGSPALLLITTRKTSPLRWLWLPCFLALAHSLITELFNVSPLIVTKTFLGAMSIDASLVVIAMWFIVQPESRDLAQAGVYQPHDSLFVKVLKTMGRFYNFRGVGTAWETKRLRPHPQFLRDRRADDGKISVKWFLFRQTLIVCWQWFLINVIFEAGLEQPAEEMYGMIGDDKEFKYRHWTADEWKGRILVGVIPCLTQARISIDIWYRIASIVVVSLGLSTPETWLPLFGSIFEVYTIRGCWSALWHQYLRWPITTMSTFLTRTVFRLPASSVIERCLNVALVFFMSGVTHVLHDVYDPLTPSSTYGPTLAFFSSFAVAIILEDVVQTLWRTMTSAGPRNADAPVPLWHKAVGYTWVFAWFLFVSPWFLFPKARLPFDTVDFAPYHIPPHIGPPAAGALLGVGSPILLLGIGGVI